MESGLVLAFTGSSRQPPTAKQAAWLIDRFHDLGPAVVHHGGAVHADTLAHRIARTLDIPVTVHPGTNTQIPEGWLADPDVTILVAKAPLTRNRDMVRASGVLLGLPHKPEFLRSGTWSTVRFGRKLGRHIETCLPDGEATVEEAA